MDPRGHRLIHGDTVDEWPPARRRDKPFGVSAHLGHLDLNAQSGVGPTRFPRLALTHRIVRRDETRRTVSAL
ncbi:MAG: hypothetical protein RJA70_1881 [Pseudomonadota bacterium]|jgi:hypothetical protein